MSDDDQLREALQRSATLPARAPEALERLRPQLRRVRRQQIGILIASTGLLVGGTGAAAWWLNSTPGQIVSDGEPPTATMSDSEFTRETSDDLDPTIGEVGRNGPPDSVTGPSDEHVVETSGEGSGTTARSATVPPSTQPTAEPAPSQTSIPPGGTAVPGGVSTSAPPDEDTDDGVDAGDSDDGTEQDGDDATPPSPDGVVVERSSCGDVTVDLATSPPTLMGIEPAPGYTYRIEDPEPHRIVVQFQGPGEDCEVKVPADALDD